MRKKQAIVLIAGMTGLVVSVFLLTPCSVYAVYTVAKHGAWPDNWPKELEPLRAQSYTLDLNAERIYGVPFTSREQFESAWPHILAVKSEKAPLILLSESPNTLKGVPMIDAGIRIRAPWTGVLHAKGSRYYPPGAESAIPDGKFVRVGPPWPDYIDSGSGPLPEYVVYQDGKWMPYDPNKKNDYSMRETRARIDIELVVDGEIVDLNRIPLPADTPIIDKRFSEGYITTNTGEGRHRDVDAAQ